MSSHPCASRCAIPATFIITTKVRGSLERGIREDGARYLPLLCDGRDLVFCGNPEYKRARRFARTAYYEWWGRRSDEILECDLWVCLLRPKPIEHLEVRWE